MLNYIIVVKIINGEIPSQFLVSGLELKYHLILYIPQICVLTFNEQITNPFNSLVEFTQILIHCTISSIEVFDLIELDRTLFSIYMGRVILANFSLFIFQQLVFYPLLITRNGSDPNDTSQQRKERSCSGILHEPFLVPQICKIRRFSHYFLHFLPQRGRRRCDICYIYYVCHVNTSRELFTRRFKVSAVFSVHVLFFWILPSRNLDASPTPLIFPQKLTKKSSSPL